MRKEYDLSKGWRSEYWKKMPPMDRIDRHTKVRITIFIDNDILKFFKARAAKRGKPAYQTQINQALREYMDGRRPPTKSSHDEHRLIAHLAEQVAKYAGTEASKPRPKRPKK